MGQGRCQPALRLVQGLALFPLIGGFLADRFLGTHRSVLMGGTLIALGHIVLGITGLGALGQSPLGMSLFMGGLAIIILGTGYFKPSSAVMVGHSTRRRTHAGTAPSPSITWASTWGSSSVPLSAARLARRSAGTGTSARRRWACWRDWGFTCWAGRIPGRHRAAPFRTRASLAPAILFVVPLLLSALTVWLYQIGAFGKFTLLVADVSALPILGKSLEFGLPILVVGLVVWFVAVQKPGDKGPTAAIFLFMIFNAFFWLAYEQAGST